MDRDGIIKLLHEHADELHQKFHVKSLALFGSVARNQASSTSDVDLLVTFDQPVGLFIYIELQQHLSALLGSPVDLVTEDAIRPEWRRDILTEVVRAA